MYLIHGLTTSIPTSTLDSLITVSVNDRKANVSLSCRKKYELSLTITELLPGDKVTIQVNGNLEVRDGFNQPLQESSESFNTEDVQDELLDFVTRDVIVFPTSRAENRSWPIFGRSTPKKKDCEMEVFYHPLDEAMQPIFRLHEEVRESTLLNAQRYRHIAPRQNVSTDLGFTEIHTRVTELMESTESRVLAAYYSSYCSNGFASFILGSDTVFTTMRTPGLLTLFASNLFTMEPVPNVTLKFFSLHYHTEEVVEGTTATTNSSGFATFTGDDSRAHGHLVATSPDKSVSFIGDFDIRDAESIHVGSATTDRGVYNLGETVFVTGVVRRRYKNELIAVVGYSVVGHSSWGSFGATTSKFGTFNFTFDVPPDARYGKQSLQFSFPCNVGFVVADPRIPTAALTIAPSGRDIHLTKNPTFGIRVTTRTYAGQPIAHSNVSVNVAISGAHSSESNSKEEHHLLTTDDGSLATNIALPGVDGETATITATWIAPTRELLIKKITIPIRAALVTLSVSKPPGDDNFISRVIPGVPHALYVTLDASKEPHATQLAPTRLVNISVFPTEKKPGSFVFDRKSSSVVNVLCLLATNSTFGEYSNFCSVSLPSMGVFHVDVSSGDSEGNAALGSIRCGEAEEAWSMYPLRGQYPITASFSSASGYTRGATVEVTFKNPYAYTAKALYMCTDSSTALKVVDVPTGTSHVQLPPSTCDCPNVGITILTPETTTTIVDASKFPVPISATADFNAPTHFDYSLTPICSEAPHGMQVVITPSATEAAPYSTVDAVITITDADGSPVEAEVTVLVTDKALLELNAPSAFALPPYSRESEWLTTDSRDDYMSPSYVKAMSEHVMQVSEKNPWLQGSSIVQTNLAHMSTRRAGGDHGHYDLTAFPNIWAPAGPPDPHTKFARYQYDMIPTAICTESFTFSTPESAPVPIESLSLSNRLPPEQKEHMKTGNEIHVRGAYAPTTAIVTATTNASNGNVTIKIPLNANIGTWVVRAIAVRAAGTHPVAMADAEIVTRKQLHLVPSVPRGVRFGDNFTAGVMASAKVVTSATVTLDATMCRGLKLIDASSSKTVSLTPSVPVEVLFELNTAQLDSNCSLTFTIADDGPASDGISVDVPVRAALAPVSVGTSFVLKDTMKWNEGLAYPSAIPGGRVNITTSVGRLAAIEAIASSMLAGNNDDDLRGGDLLDRVATFVALFPYANSGDKLLTDDKIRSTSLDATYARSKQAFTEAVEMLGDFTTASLGFRHTRKIPVPEYCDLHLNLRAIHTFRYLLPQAGNSIPRLYESASLEMLQQLWENAVIAELEKMMAEVRRHRRWTPSPSADLSAIFYHSLGSTPDSRYVERRDWMGVLLHSWEDLVSHAPALSLSTQAIIFSTMVRDDVNPGVQAKLQAAFLNQLRITGRTAFVAQGSGSGNAPNPETSATLFHALTLSNIAVEQQIIEKLANFVAEDQNAFGGSWYYYCGGNVERMLALRGYDLAHLVTNPAITVSVKNGTTDVLKSIRYFGVESLRLVDEQSYEFSNLAKSATDSPSGTNCSLAFSSEGTGEASVVLSLNFIPQLPQVNLPRYFGLFVEKSTMIVSGAHAGKELDGRNTPLQPGDLVKVTIAVTTPDDVHSVIITDHTSGGLEPVDSALSGAQELLADARNLAASLDSAPSESEEGETAYYGFFGQWWWMWFFQFTVEVKADRVVCTGYSPRAGTYECTYFATATTSGDFVVPPAVAVVLNQPEVMGLSKYAFAKVESKKN